MSRGVARAAGFAAVFYGLAAGGLLLSASRTVRASLDVAF